MTDKKSKGNQGIIITGGTISAEQLAVGTNAKAEKIIQAIEQGDNTKTISDLREQLNYLLELIRENSSMLEPNVEKAIEVVKAEADKPSPNKIVMTSIIDGVIQTVKSLTSIAGAITAIKKLIDIVI